MVSFTGSTKIGRHISAEVHRRFGKTVLELGGNNATVVMPDSDLELTFQGSIFGAVGTCGQRCTTLRRLFLHESIYDYFVARMVKAYPAFEQRMSDPLDDNTQSGSPSPCCPQALTPYARSLRLWRVVGLTTDANTAFHFYLKFTRNQLFIICPFVVLATFNL